MNCVEFQVQVRDGSDIYTVMKEVDPQAPIAQPLEGGNGQGPLYQCILQESKVEEMKRRCDETSLYLHMMSKLQIDKSLYRPDYYVKWQFAAKPTVSKTRFE